MHQFYDPTDIGNWSILNQIFATLSFLGSLFMVISYIMFPSKRGHPGTLLLHGIQLPEIGHVYRVTCLDDITSAMHGNSLFCTIQSLVQAFSSLYLVFWINVFILNLHLTIVWRKDWLSERYTILGITAFLYAGIPAIGLTVLGTAVSNGFMCMADSEHVKQWLLYPMAAVGWPGVFLTFHTVGFLMVKLITAPGAATTAKFKPSPEPSIRESTINRASEANGKWFLRRDTTVNNVKLSIKQELRPLEDEATKLARRKRKQREKMWNVIEKSWRSLALCVTIVVIFGTFWSLKMEIISLFQSLPEIGNGYRTTCLDDITSAMHGNSHFCTVQSFVQAFAALYLVFWINIFILNLHLTIVWRKDWLSERYAILGTTAILYAGVPAIALTALGTAASNGFMCMADGEHVKQWLLYPMAAVGWPGVLLTLYTVGFLMVKLMSAPGAASTATEKRTASVKPNTASSVRSSNFNPAASETNSKWFLKGDTSANSVHFPIKTEQPVVEDNATKLARRLKKHREKMWGILVKSWRSLAMCIAIVLIFGSFWSINLEISIVFESVTSKTPWLVEWYTCALQGNSRAACAKVVAPFVPSIATMALSDITSCIGFVTFLIFGTGVYEDWKKLLAEKIFKK
ncbi:hypothetical protein HDU98_006435 [Podochytrium sp. JEL0797]|nr:hypothetical protein HDU98_006435 [Podochytrium sp. JEL0797]